MNFNITIWSFFLLVGALQSFLLSIVFFLKKNDNRKSQMIFGVILLIFTIILFDHSLRLSELYKNFPYGLYISDSLWYLLAPLIWFYIKSRFGNFRFKLKDVIHFVPFVSFVIIYRRLLIANPDLKVIILENYLSNNSIHSTKVKIFILIMMIQILVYLLMSLFHLLRYEKKYKLNYSNNKLNHLITLKRIILFFLTYFLFEFSFSTFRNFFNIQNKFIENWSLVMWVFFMISLSYTIMRYPDLMFKKIIRPKSKYENLNVANLTMKLTTFMTDSSPYLDSNLSLNKLADSIDVKPNQLSYLLNTTLKTSFYDYINSHRVRHVARLLDEGEHKKLSIYGIAQMSGFKSKASFYSFFRNEFGTTPKKYISDKHMS